MAHLLLRLSICLVLLTILTGCSGSTAVSPSATPPAAPITTQTSVIPTPTRTQPTSIPAWSQAEASLSASILGTSGGKCEWEVWGWLEEKVYVWALCQAGPGLESSAASVPAVVWVRQDQSIQNVEIPGDGTAYGLSIRRMFPPALQARVFDHNFDVKAAEERLAARWKDAALPPRIYAETGDPLPREGEESVPAISAEFVDRIVPVSRLGEGSINKLTFLSDGRLVAYGDQGIEMIDLVQMQSSRPFEGQMEGSAGSLSSDGSLLAVWSERQVQVIRLGDNQVISTISTNLPGGKVVNVDFLPNGEILAVEVHPPGEEVYSNQIEIYRMRDGALLNTWDMQGRAMLFSPDGKVMASRYLMGGLKLWSIPDGKLLQSMRAVVGGGAAFSPDGRLFAASDMGVVRVFRVAEGEELYYLPADIGPVSGVAFSPDGKRLITWSSESYTTRLWNSAYGTLALEIPVEGVTAGAFTLDGTGIALAGNGIMGLYSATTGALTSNLGDHYPAVAALSFAPVPTSEEDPRLAVLYGVNTQHNLLANWDITHGTRRFLSDAYSGISLEYTSGPFGIAVGTWDGIVQMVDQDNGSLLRIFEGLSAQVQSLAQNVWFELAASSMNEVRIFSLPNREDNTGRKIDLPGGWVDHLAWPCYLIAASHDGTVHVLYETEDGTEQTLKTPDEGYGNHLAVSQDCRHVMVGKNRSVYQWQTSDWEALPTWAMPDVVTALAISPDGSLVAVGLAGGEVQLYERKTGHLLRELDGHPGGVNALDFSSDGSFLASGGGDGIVVVWGVK